MSASAEAEAELQAGSVDITADIQLAVGKSLDKFTKDLLKYVPIPRKVDRSGTSNAAGNTVVLNFGSPSQARLWNLLSITVVGNTDSQQINNSLVAVYVGSYLNGNFSLADCIVPATFTVPLAVNWNKDQVFCAPEESVFAVVYSPGANQSLVGSIRVLDYDRTTRWAGL